MPQIFMTGPSFDPWGESTVTNDIYLNQKILPDDHRINQITDVRLYLNEDDNQIDIYALNVNQIHINLSQKLQHSVREAIGNVNIHLIGLQDSSQSEILDSIKHLPRTCDSILNVLSYGEYFNFDYLSYPENYYYVHCDWDLLMSKYPEETIPYFMKFFFTDSNGVSIMERTYRANTFNLAYLFKTRFYTDIYDIYSNKDSILDVYNSKKFNKILDNLEM